MPRLNILGRAWRWLLGGSEHPRRLTTAATAANAGLRIDGRALAMDAATQQAAPTMQGTGAAPLSAPADGPSLSRMSRSPAESRAALMSAFDAAHPVQRRRALRGRDEQLEAMFDGVLYQRKHAIVHGARGSGKTSLVRVFADHADRQGVVLIYLACDAHTDFAGLMQPFIRFIPAGSIPVGRERAFRAQAEALGSAFGPSTLVSMLVELAPKPIIFILDEFDRVTDSSVKDAVATTMKLLSDSKAPVQLLVVGIGQSVTELVEHHPSLRRHMVAIPVGGIADQEIAKLIKDGAGQARIVFTDAATALVAEAACGSPYHARLFAYHAGMAALHEGTETLSLGVAATGIRRAIEEWGRMNQEDHDLFARLTAPGPASRASLMAVAALAAREQWVTPDRIEGAGPEAVRALAPALEVDGVRGRFRDSLAPQFLIAMLLVAQGDEAAVPFLRMAGIGEMLQ